MSAPTAKILTVEEYKNAFPRANCPEKAVRFIVFERYLKRQWRELPAIAEKLIDNETEKLEHAGQTSHSQRYSTERIAVVMK